MKYATTIERFWARVNKNGPIPEANHQLGPCWVWIGSKRSKGYGAFVYPLNGEVVQGRAHRYSYEIHNGPIPDGLCVLHKCDNPPCVNPQHLFLGTKADNNRDIIEKGHHVRGGTYGPGGYKRGDAHHNARLTPEIIRSIRQEYAGGLTSYGKLAAKYGIVVAHVFRIVKRRVWQHVE